MSHIIVNPTARSASAAVRAVRAAATRLGQAEPRVIATSPREHGRRQAQAVLLSGGKHIIAIGGDGTVRDVVGGLEGSDVTLGIIPAGTANLFARNLGLPIHSLHAAARCALDAQPRPVDLGRIRLLPVDAAPSDHVFLVVAGIGRDAEAVQAANVMRKRRWGWMAYIAPGIRRLGAAPIPLRAKFDDEQPVQTQAWSLLVHNSAKIPAGFSVVPDARPDDGTLHVAVVSPRHVLHWGRIAMSGMGLARAEGAIRHRTPQRIRVRAETPQTVQIDGDPFGRVLGFDAWIDPGALLVRAPLPERRN